MNSISNLHPAASSRAFKAWRPHCARALERVARCMRREAEAIYYCFVLHFSSRNTVLNIRTAPAELVPSLCTCSVPFPSIVFTAVPGQGQGGGAVAAGFTLLLLMLLAAAAPAAAAAAAAAANTYDYTICHLEIDHAIKSFKSRTLASCRVHPTHVPVVAAARGMYTLLSGLWRRWSHVCCCCC